MVAIRDSAVGVVMVPGPTAAIINHLLVQSGWALQRLAVHAGKTARFNVAPFSIAYTVQADGRLVAVMVDDADADATCTIPPSLLSRLVVHDETAFAQIEGRGDAALLAEICYLSRHLSWDAAEDLSRVTGDIVAERIVQYAKVGKKHTQDAALNFSQALAEYWTEERPLIAKATHVTDFVQQVDGLRDNVARLEQRINRLSVP